MSDIDPTPGTPVTLGDRLAWFRGDVAANQLAALAELAALRAGPANSLAELAALLGALRGPAGATLSTLLTETQFDAALIITNGLLADIKDELITLNDRADKIQAVLGAEPYSSTETANIRALLISLLAAQGNVGILPDNPGSAVIGSATITQNGRRYVVWNADIPGLTRSNSNIALTPVNDWTGYEVYVQSEADTCWVGVNQDVPTNSWLSAPLTGTVEISVSSQYAVRAYMRVPAIAYNIILETAAYSGGTTVGVDWSKYSYGASTNQGAYAYSKSILLLSALQGFTLEANPANSGNVTVYTYLSQVDANPFTQTVVAPGVSVVLPAGAGLSISGTPGNTLRIFGPS